MVVLLNLLIPLVGLFWMLVFWLTSRKKDTKGTIKTGCFSVVGLIVSIYLVMSIQPSYLPKGEIVKSTVPSFEYKELEVEDRVKRTNTMDNYQRTKEMHEEFMTE